MPFCECRLKGKKHLELCISIVNHVVDNMDEEGGSAGKAMCSFMKDWLSPRKKYKSEHGRHAKRSVKIYVLSE